jgi:hypothetical protein
VAELARDGLGLGDPNGFMDLTVVFASIALSYIALARRGAGATAGERLLAVTYRRWSPGKTLLMSGQSRRDTTTDAARATTRCPMTLKSETNKTQKATDGVPNFTE